MSKVYGLQQLFIKARENQSTHCDVNTLVDTAFKMAVSNLRLMHRRIHKLILYEHLTIDNIAIDAIAPLFIKNETGILNQITDVYAAWEPPIQNEDDAVYFFNKLVSKRVEQHICFLLRQSDPFFSKILDSVNYIIKKNGYNKSSYLGSTYILPADLRYISGDVLQYQDMEQLPAELFKDKKYFIEHIFEFIRRETNHFQAIPLNPLIFRLKVLNSELFRPENSTNTLTVSLEIDSVINKALVKTFEKLENSYVSKGKLTPEERVKFEKALEDMVNDLRDGGLNPGLYKYLKDHFSGLSEDEYNYKYHNILEYLVKLLKENIAELL